MVQRTRMFKTLGCLAGAMTGAAAWLGWIDPSDRYVVDVPPFEVTLRRARSVVADNVAVRSDRWNDVEVVVGPAAPTPSLFLAATTDRREDPESIGGHHFLVDLDGRASRTARWSRQEVLPSADGTVRIQVARARPSLRAPRLRRSAAGRDAHRQANQVMSPTQWRCVQALIAALREKIDVSSEHRAPAWQDGMSASRADMEYGQRRMPALEDRPQRP